jgi:hypothetical protein
MTLRVFASSISTRGLLPQMPNVHSTSQENSPITIATTTVTTTPSTVTTATEKQEETIDTKIGNMMKIFKAWNFQLWKATDLRYQYAGYRMARAYVFPGEIPLMHPYIHMNHK